ncbi:ADP-ribosyltransferase [Massilia scottii]|uniref:ADP-ribosyltransferase n=1 Tax=Massilia scottii TaxID=3057166 RepID=UPI0035B558E1
MQGKSGILVNSLSQYASEAEVLFKPGTKFAITKVIDAVPGINTTIILEEILK